MERRNDQIFRQVVDQVEAGLTDSGFRLFDRGWLGEYRWVEFTRLRWDPAERAREEHLVLYHLADHRHIGARLHSRNPAERARSGDVTMNLWDYEPSTADASTQKATLCAEVRGWVADAVDLAS
jgi:hypothetical protein